MTSNDRVQRIIDAISEVENNEELGRIAGETMLQIFRTGQSAWEAFFEMLDSCSENERDEIKARFFEWSETENIPESSID